MPRPDAAPVASRRHGPLAATALALGTIVAGLILVLAARASAAPATVSATVPVAGAVQWQSASPLDEPRLTSASPLDEPPPRADLVVDFGDGRVTARRLALAPGMTGLGLLQGADLALIQSGGAVCAMGGTGCPAADCFCHSDRYWAYFQGDGAGGWSYANEGPAQHLLAAGDVEGWAWGAGTPPITATATTRAVLLALDWLATRQLVDGSQGGHAGLTAEHVLAARAVGIDPNQPVPGGVGAVDFLRRRAIEYAAESLAATGKLAVAAAAAHEDPAAFGGVDLPERILAAYDPATGQLGTSVWDQSWAILGLAASGEAVPAKAREALAAAAVNDGGWGATFGADEADPDSTGLALQALVAAGAPVTDSAVTGALDWLSAGQSPDGGWAHHPADPSNVNSTAYALQGLLAAGEDPRGPRWTTAPGTNPVDFLLAQQRGDGHFAFDTSPADLVATLQVVPALAGSPALTPSRRVAARRAMGWMGTQRTAEGGFEGFNPGATLDAVLALASWGLEANPANPAGRTPADYLASQAPDYAGRGASAAGKLLAGTVALGADPRQFGGLDLVAAVEATRNVTGTYGTGNTWDTSWAILGLAAAGAGVPPPAIDGLLAAASPGAGWGFAARAPEPDVDSTGLALQALAAGLGAAGGAVTEPGPDGAAVAAATAWLRTQLHPSGAFRGYGAQPSAASTALALGGLAAWGQEVEGPGWRADAAGALARRSPVDGLLALQSPRGGFAGFAGADDPGATYAALLGLALRPLPIVPAAGNGRTLWLPWLGAAGPVRP